jgi:H+/Cl- antiporter ClcA
MLIMGAAFGRLFGVILNSMFPLAGLDPGIYALLGATGNLFFPPKIFYLKLFIAFMGGVTRMTISLVVIILEITHDMEALLPIMLVAVVAKWTGDMFGHSLYDEQLHIGIIPSNALP